jgi:hypothetical protein
VYAEDAGNLRLARGVANIAAMYHIRNRLMRKLIAGIAMIMMVLCQGTAIAAICMPATSAQSEQIATAAPCHEAGSMAAQDDGSGNNSRPGYCQTSQVSPEPSKAGADTAIDLPLLAAYAAAAPVTARCTTTHEPRLHRALSPPLPITLCRLLN